MSIHKTGVKATMKPPIWLMIFSEEFYNCFKSVFCLSSNKCIDIYFVYSNCALHLFTASINNYMIISYCLYMLVVWGYKNINELTFLSCIVDLWISISLLNSFDLLNKPLYLLDNEGSYDRQRKVCVYWTYFLMLSLSSIKIVI